jgi:hypothetical protein
MTLDAAPQGRVDRAVRTPSFLVAVTACLSASLLAGCFTTNGASANAIPMVRVMASSDLDCPQKDVRIVQSLGGQFQAFGCGHKASYTAACEALNCVVAPEGQQVPWRARPDPAPTPGSTFNP